MFAGRAGVGVGHRSANIRDAIRSGGQAASEVLARRAADRRLADQRTAARVGYGRPHAARHGGIGWEWMACWWGLLFRRRRRRRDPRRCWLPRSRSRFRLSSANRSRVPGPGEPMRRSLIHREPSSCIANHLSMFLLFYDYCWASPVPLTSHLHLLLPEMSEMSLVPPLGGDIFKQTAAAFWAASRKNRVRHSHSSLTPSSLQAQGAARHCLHRTGGREAMQSAATPANG